MSTSSTARHAVPLSVASLADHLQQGPLACLGELQTRAAEISREVTTDDREQLEQLAEVVRLSQCAMQRFHDFTRELHALVADLAAESAERH